MKISSRNQLSVILVAFSLALAACSKTVKVGPQGEQGGGAAAQSTNQTPETVTVADGTLLTGDGAPKADLGKDGDSYFDKSGRKLYSRRGGVWSPVADFNNAVVSGCAEGDVILMKEGTTLEQLNARDAVKKYDIGCTVRIETYRDGVLNIKYFEKQPGRPGKDSAALAQFNLIKEFDIRNGKDGANGLSGGAGYDAPSDNDGAPVGSTYVQIFPQKLESGEERVVFIYFLKRTVEGKDIYVESGSRQNTGDLRGKGLGFELIEGTKIAIFLKDAQGNEIPGTRQVTDSLKGADGTSLAVETLADNKVAIYRTDAQGKEIPGSRTTLTAPAGKDGTSAGFEILDDSSVAIFREDAQGKEIPGTRKVTQRLKGADGTSVAMEKIADDKVAVYRIDAQGNEIPNSRTYIQAPKGRDGNSVGFEILSESRIAIFSKDAEGKEILGTRQITERLKGADGTSVTYEKLANGNISIFRIDSSGKEVSDSRQEIKIPAGVSSEIVMGNENVEARRDARVDESTILQVNKQDKVTTLTLFKKIAGAYTPQSQQTITDGADAQNQEISIPRYAFGFIAPELGASEFKVGDIYLYDSIDGDKIVRRTFVRRVESSPAVAGDFQQVGNSQEIPLPAQNPIAPPVASSPTYVPVLKHPAERALMDKLPVGTIYSQMVPSVTRNELEIQVTMTQNEFRKIEGNGVEPIGASESVSVSVSLPEGKAPVTVSSNTTIRMGTPSNDDGAENGAIVYQLVDTAEDAKLIPFKKVDGVYVPGTDLQKAERLEILVITKAKISAPIAYRLVTGPEADPRKLKDSAAVGSVIFHSTYETKVEETEAATIVRVYNTIMTYARGQNGYDPVAGGESKSIVVEMEIAKAPKPVDPVDPPVHPGKPPCKDDEIIAAKNTVIDRSYGVQRDQLNRVYLQTLKNSSSGGTILNRLTTAYSTFSNRTSTQAQKAQSLATSRATYNSVFPMAIGSSLLSKKIEGGVFGNVRGDTDNHTYVSMDPRSLTLAAVSRERKTLSGVECPRSTQTEPRPLCDLVITHKLEWLPGIQAEDFHNPDIDSYGVRRYEHYVAKSTRLLDSETREPIQLLKYQKSDAVSFLDQVKTELAPKCDPVKTDFSKFKFDRIPVPGSNNQR